MKERKERTGHFAAGTAVRERDLLASRGKMAINPTQCGISSEERIELSTPLFYSVQYI